MKDNRNRKKVTKTIAIDWTAPILRKTICKICFLNVIDSKTEKPKKDMDKNVIENIIKDIQKTTGLSTNDILDFIILDYAGLQTQTFIREHHNKKRDVNMYG